LLGTYYGEEESVKLHEIMTTKEVAEYLKIHKITVCKYAATGKIPAFRVGRVWRFNRESIEKWVNGSKKED
jgi:excisionase family DNA binding protein